MQAPHSVDPNRCPLCGQPNQCAQELARTTGEKQPPCWCTQATFAADVLAKVPAGARNTSCICAACAKGADTTKLPE